jgi:hypothetical protein
MRLMAMPSLSQKTESLEIVEAVGGSERQAVVAPDRLGQAAFPEQADEGLDDGQLAGRFKSFAHEDHARGLAGHRQGVTVLAVAELELTLEVGAPEIIGPSRLRERRAHGLVRPVPLAGLAHKAVAVKHGMHRTLGRDAHVAGQPAYQKLAGLAGAPVRLVLLEAHDRPLDLVGQLVGVAHRPPRPIRQRIEPLLPLAI